MIVLDSGAISILGQRTPRTPLLLKLLRQQDWPAVVPSLVLVECLTGDRRDANANRVLKTCNIAEELPEVIARRAAHLRYRAHRGSAVDAVVVAMAEPGDVVLTTNSGDIGALAACAESVTVVAL
jgi:hypothetical protein